MNENQISNTEQNSYIFWRIHLNVNKKEKLKNEINKLQRLVNLEFLDINSQKYWKDNNLFEITFKTKLENKEKSNIVFEMLNYANVIGNSINVTGPFEFENGKMEFEMIINKFKVTSLKWCNINLL